MRWPLQPLQPLQKKLQPPLGPSVGSLCHPCITTTHLSYRCPILETSATALRGTAGTPDQELGLVPNVTLGRSIFEVVGSYTKGFISAGEPGDVFSLISLTDFAPRGQVSLVISVFWWVMFEVISSRVLAIRNDLEMHGKSSIIFPFLGYNWLQGWVCQCSAWSVEWIKMTSPIGRSPKDIDANMWRWAAGVRGWLPGVQKKLQSMQNALSWLVVIGKPWEAVFNHYFKRWESIVFFDGSCWKDVGFLMPSGQRLMVWSEPQVFSWFPWITFFVPWNVGEYRGVYRYTHVLSWIITMFLSIFTWPYFGIPNFQCVATQVGPGEFHRHECMFKTLSDAINIQVFGVEMGKWVVGGPWNWMVWDFRHNPRMYVQNMHNMYILYFEYVAIQCYINI